MTIDELLALYDKAKEYTAKRTENTLDIISRREFKEALFFAYLAGAGLNFKNGQTLKTIDMTNFEKECVTFVSGYMEAGVSAKDYVKAFAERLLGVAREELISESVTETPKEDKLRYCVEYINPCFPLLDNGGLNVRHLRVPDEHGAEMAITLILSFGGKIYALYRGNVKDGKLADWPTPMIVEQEDWFTDEWLHELMDCGQNCL